MQKTIRDLKALAETLGYTKEQVMALFESGGLGGKFQPSRWNEYMALLVTHAQKIEALLLKVDNLSENIKSGECPICGARIVWRTTQVWVFGPDWECSAGGATHYWLDRTNKARQDRGLPPLERESYERVSQERRERDEFIRKHYWQAVFGELSEDEAIEFERAAGTPPWRS